MVAVRNMRNTSDAKLPTGYSSWKEYWEEKKGRRFTLCSCCSCSNWAEEGSHVEKVDWTGMKYIVPLCYKCNNPSNTGIFCVRDADLLQII